MLIRGKAPFPQLDLAQHRVSLMALTTAIPLSDTIERVMEDDDFWQDDYYGAQKYRVRKTDHLLSESVTLVPGEEEVEGDVLLVRVAYQTDGVPTGPVPQPFRQAGVLMAELGDVLRQVPLVNCNVVLRFARDEAAARPVWFPLPQPVVPEGDRPLPVDEIRGVRGVKRAADGREEHEFILDSDEDGALTLSVDFEVEEPLSTGLPARAMARAVAIAAGLGLG